MPKVQIHRTRCSTPSHPSAPHPVIQCAPPHVTTATAPRPTPAHARLAGKGQIAAHQVGRVRLAASTPGWCLTLPLNVGPSVVCRCVEPLLVSMQGRRLSFGPCEVQDAAALQPVLHYGVQMHVPRGSAIHAHYICVLHPSHFMPRFAVCLPGYTVDNNGGCVDIDECANATLTTCSAYAQCTNTPGNYT